MERIDKDYTLLTIVILLAIIYFNWQNYFEYILLGLIVFAIAISASFLFGLKENKNDTVGIMVSFVLAINIVMFFLLLLSKYFNLTL